MARILFWFSATSILITGCAAKGSFLELVDSNASVSDAEQRLLTELTNIAKHGDRVESLQHLLRPLFDAVPKESNGRVNHAVVIYMLHRFFETQRGWTIRGLEPKGLSQNSTSLEMQGWMPEYLQSFLESIVGMTSLGLREVSALAATLEDFIQKEERQWLDKVYALLGLTKESISKAELSMALEVYLMIYNLDGNLTITSPLELKKAVSEFSKQMSVWNNTQEFIRHVVDDAWKQRELGLNYEEVLGHVREVGEHYSTVYDNDCKNMKSELVRIESKKPGRVRLTDFYKVSLNGGVWEFTEKRDYLRSFGALDESDPSTPLVIIPNYVGGRQNCLTASSYYSLCCRNECEELLQSLEKKIAAPTAEPAQILAVVKSLPSSTISAPRTLPATLKDRLEQVASLNDGHVPLHGRLFAQWMHHAFPRECAYPHEAGTISALTPDEWMKETGQENSKATTEEMLEHIRSDTCRLTPTGADCGHHRTLLSKAAGATDQDIVEDLELPWNEKEELLVVRPSLPDPVTSTKSSYVKDFFAFMALASVVSALSLSWRSVWGFLPSAASKKSIKCIV